MDKGNIQTVPELIYKKMSRITWYSENIRTPLHQFVKAFPYEGSRILSIPHDSAAPVGYPWIGIKYHPRVFLVFSGWSIKGKQSHEFRRRGRTKASKDSKCFVRSFIHISASILPRGGQNHSGFCFSDRF